MNVYALVLLTALFLFGCIKAPGGAAATPTPIEELIHEDLNATVTPETELPDTAMQENTANQNGQIAAEVNNTDNVPTDAVTEVETGNTQITDAVNQTQAQHASASNQNADNQTIAQEAQVFSVEMDDGGFYPDTITVNAGQPVNLTLHLRTQNVYHDGADVKSEYVNASFRPGQTQSRTFTPTHAFSITEYWPATGVIKGILQIKAN